MITHKPALDWATLTTYSLRSALEADALLQHLTKSAKDVVPKQIMQYDGVQGDGFFFGEGIQRGKTHFMARVSGELAHSLALHPLLSGFDCSRIDIQLTLPIVENPYPVFLEAFKAITEHEKGRGVRARQVNAILNADGFCTLYIGSRTSERLYRIYTKEHGDSLYLRFEVEYKGKSGLAGKVYRQSRNDEGKLLALVAGELGTLAGAGAQLVDHFTEYIANADIELLMNGRKRPDEHTTLAWLAKQVMPSWKRVLGNEDTRDRAVMMLYELYKFYEGLTNE